MTGSEVQAAGPLTRLPGNPAWRSSPETVLRPREYYRVTPAVRHIKERGLWIKQRKVGQ
jgi:hypothetical protein